MTTPKKETLPTADLPPIMREVDVVRHAVSALTADGWTVWPLKGSNHCDIVASRNEERLYAEAKGETPKKGSSGLDCDTMYGQLLRRMKDETSEARYLVIVPTSYVAKATRVEPWVRDRLGIELFEMTASGEMISRD